MRRRIIWGVLVVSVAVLLAPTAAADPSQSAHYQLPELVIGGSGLNSAQSANFQSSQTSGILGLGTSTSTDFQFSSGGQTTSDPALAFGITAPTVNFGAFSAGAATVATSSFEVSDYTSYGYIVQILGNPPSSSSGHTIPAMSTTGPSQAGIEQFGINLVANTSPVSVGANPDHGQFGTGSAAANYGTSNNYRYVSGETIASAPKSSGVTTYTISYLVNVSSLTPAGQYATNQTLVCTGTF